MRKVRDDLRSRADRSINDLETRGRRLVESFEKQLGRVADTARLLRDVGAGDAMAIPIDAFFSAGASFTPSPVMATTAPFAVHARTMRSLCSAVTRA